MHSEPGWRKITHVSKYYLLKEVDTGDGLIKAYT